MVAPRLSRIAEYLLKSHVLDEFQMKSALAEQAKWGHRLTRVLNDRRLAPESKVVAALAEHTKLQVADLDSVSRDAAALGKLDAAFCAERGVFPCALQEGGKLLYLAMCDPTDFRTTEEVERKTRCRLRLMIAGESAVAAAIQRCYRNAKPPSSKPQGSIEMGEEGSASSPMSAEFVDSQGAVLTTPKASPPARPPERAAKPPPPVTAPSAAEALSSLFDFEPEALTPEERSRLEAIRQNQERGNLILRVVLELCVEKGLLSADDVNDLGL